MGGGVGRQWSIGEELYLCLLDPLGLEEQSTWSNLLFHKLRAMKRIEDGSEKRHGKVWGWIIGPRWKRTK